VGGFLKVWFLLQLSTALTAATYFSCDSGEKLFFVQGKSPGGSATFLMCVKDTKLSKVFAPPGTATFSGTTSSDVGSVHLTFDGHVENTKINGRLNVVSNYDSIGNTSYEVHGEAVEALIGGPIESTIVYSNRQFMHESGDLLGADFLVVEGNKKKIGFLTFYQGQWAEPYRRPIMLLFENPNRASSENGKYKVITSKTKLRIAKEGWKEVEVLKPVVRLQRRGCRIR